MKVGGEKIEAEALIELVTKNLNTYGTKEHSEKLESDRAAVAWLIEAEREHVE